MKHTLAGCLALACCVALPASAEEDEKSPGQLFYAAIDREDADAVKALLAAGNSAKTPIVNGDVTSTPLVKACWRRNMELVQLLVDAGADVNGLEKTRVVNDAGEVHWFITSPLEEVVGKDLEIVRYLSRHGDRRVARLEPDDHVAFSNRFVLNQGHLFDLSRDLR